MPTSTSEYMRAWREANRDRAQAYQREYRKNNKEKLDAYKRDWRANNKHVVNSEEYKAVQRAWRARNPDKVRQYNEAARNKPGERDRQRDAAKRGYYKRKYDLTPDQKQQMLEAQGGVCVICQRDTPGSKRGWSVDHNHITGRVRAILCAPCNTMIGHARESTYALGRAILYLEGHEAMDEANGE
jgi:hypothetical protein